MAASQETSTAATDLQQADKRANSGRHFSVLRRLRGSLDLKLGIDLEARSSSTETRAETGFRSTLAATFAV